MKTCPVCLIKHQREIHAATLRLHRWFRRQVLASIVRPPVGAKRAPGATGRRPEMAREVEG